MIFAQVDGYDLALRQADTCGRDSKPLELGWLLKMGHPKSMLGGQYYPRRGCLGNLRECPLPALCEGR